MTAARFRALGLVGVGVLTIAACGKEIGRIPLRDQGAGETTVQASAGKLNELLARLSGRLS